MLRPLMVVIPLWLVGLSGCGGTSPEEVLERRSMSEIFTEADKLSTDGLVRQARAYHDAIVRQNEQLDQLRRTKENLSYKEKAGPKAHQIDEQMRGLAKSISRLMKRHQVYVDRLRQRDHPIPINRD